MADNMEGFLGILDGEPAVTQVISQENVKLYRTHLTVAYLDSKVYDFGPTTFELPNPMPVFNSEMQQIGFASCAIVGAGLSTRIVADIAIDYATPERLLAETQSQKLYPRPFGNMKMAPMHVFDFQARLLVLRLRIDGIQFMPQRPVDARLLSLGERDL